MDVIKKARKHPAPYNVRFDAVLPFSFFKSYDNLHQDVTTIRPGSKVSDPTVNDIKQLRYDADGGISYKLTHRDDEVFTLLPIMRRLETPTYPEYCQLYSAPRPLTLEKYNHLQVLKGTVPQYYGHYYDALPHCDTKKSKVKRSVADKDAGKTEAGKTGRKKVPAAKTTRTKKPTDKARADKRGADAESDYGSDDQDDQVVTKKRRLSAAKTTRTKKPTGKARADKRGAGAVSDYGSGDQDDQVVTKKGAGLSPAKKSVPAKRATRKGRGKNKVQEVDV